MNAIVTDLSPQNPRDLTARALGAEPKGQPAATRKRRLRSYLALARTAVIVAGIGLAVVVPLGWGQWVAGFTNQSTDNAYLRADIAPISAQVAGTIRKVAVQDYQRVRKGDVLAEIDPSEYQAKVTRASAAVAAGEAAIRNVDSRLALQQRLIAQAEAGISAVAADRDRAQAEHARQAALTRDGWSTNQKLEEALAAIKRFEAQLTEKRADAAATREQVSVLGTQREQAEADLASSKAELALAEIELARTRIVAPSDGVVNSSSVRTGQYVSPGMRVISVVPLPNIYVVANYKETQLGKVRIGQAVSVAVDMFPGETLNGRVEQISPASGSEFALLPPDNATGNFTKVAQRIAVRIELIDIPDGLKDLLRPGMSVLSTIHTDQPAVAADR
ncbi:HlyD family secretion protein [Ensifer adhaerens]|uniref:HlyD family secretion protein n=1 Tax=Ensifer adhaerens TaxID=106592 RepID=UPI000FD83CBE|nr:HlyD family secretion protein [Ensifer adhaerens]MDF8357636.1 HlyD family secretion protein [Ensifer adhaerens]THA60219.1 HlyD family secretion protein [Ensifer adhaerens]